MKERILINTVNSPEGFGWKHKNGNWEKISPHPLPNSSTQTKAHTELGSLFSYQVEPTKYYEACVSDACACDTGGDCECFCTAVAAYAQACQEAGVCISWRTPSICREYISQEG